MLGAAVLRDTGGLTSGSGLGHEQLLDLLGEPLPAALRRVPVFLELQRDVSQAQALRLPVLRAPLGCGTVVIYCAAQ